MFIGRLSTGIVNTEKGLFHYDSVQIEKGSKLAQLVNGIEGPVTPAAAYSAWTAGESASAAEAPLRAERA